MKEVGAVGSILTDQPTSAEVDGLKAKERRFNVTAHSLRGMAAFMVFLAHVIGGIGENIYPDNGAYQAVMEAPWNFGRWGVWLFFVISGYVILPSVLRYSPREFALRRFLRLYPLFFAFSLAFLALNAITNAFPSLRDLSTIVPALLMVNLFTHTGQLTPNAWSLSYEVLFYAMACLIVYTAIRRRSVLETSILTVLAGLLVMRHPAMAFFLAGIAVRLLDDRKLHVSKPLLPPLELAAAGGCILFASLRHYTFEPKELALPGLYCLFVATVLYFWLAIQPGSLTSRLLRGAVPFYLGTISYSLYLSHPYVYFGARQLFSHAGLFGEGWALSVGIFLLTVIPATLLFTHVVYIALERYPYRWYFREPIFHS